MTWTQDYDPLHAWPVSTLVSALPVITLFFALLQILGVRVSARVQEYTSLLKTLAFALLIAACFAFAGPTSHAAVAPRAARICCLVGAAHVAADGNINADNFVHDDSGARTFLSAAAFDHLHGPNLLPGWLSCHLFPLPKVCSLARSALSSSCWEAESCFMSVLTDFGLSVCY